MAGDDQPLAETARQVALALRRRGVRAEEGIAFDVSADAVARAYRALCEFRIEGIETNRGLLQALLLGIYVHVPALAFLPYVALGTSGEPPVPPVVLPVPVVVMLVWFAVLAALGIHPRKGLSQNFLVDPAHRARIVAAALLTPEDTVVEIGPGPGLKR